MEYQLEKMAKEIRDGQVIVADSGKSVAASGDIVTGPVLPINPFML